MPKPARHSSEFAEESEANEPTSEPDIGTLVLDNEPETEFDIIEDIFAIGAVHLEFCSSAVYGCILRVGGVDHASMLWAAVFGGINDP